MKVEKLVGDWLDVNCYVVTNNKNECLIVETAVKLDNLLSVIEDKKVCGVLLTHGHFDHVGYLKEYVEHFNVPVLAHENIVKTLKDYTLNQSDEWCINEDLPLTLLSGDGKISLDGFNIEYFSTPGHSPCCVSYKIGDNLFVGDLLFYAGIGRIDMKGGNKEQMVSSLEKVKGLNFETLYSGHGEESPFERQKRNIMAYLRFLNR